MSVNHLFNKFNVYFSELETEALRKLNTIRKANMSNFAIEWSPELKENKYLDAKWTSLSIKAKKNI